MERWDVQKMASVALFPQPPLQMEQDAEIDM